MASACMSEFCPGYPASHGCIRMPAQGAEMFYAKVKVGTPVEVVQ